MIPLIIKITKLIYYEKPYSINHYINIDSWFY